MAPRHWTGSCWTERKFVETPGGTLSELIGAAEADPLSAHPSPETLAVLPPNTDEDMQAQRQGHLPAAGWLWTWTQDSGPTLFPHHPIVLGGAVPHCLSSPSGSASRTTYQQHPLELPSPSFPSPKPGGLASFGSWGRKESDMTEWLNWTAAPEHTHLLLQFDPNQFLSWASLVAQTVKTAYNSGCLGLIPESGRSPGKGNGYPLQFSYLRNSMDRRA